MTRTKGAPSRWIVVTGVLAAVSTSVAMLAQASTASAGQPFRDAFSFSNSGVTDCDTFEDRFTDYFDARLSVFADSTGNPIRVVIHWVHRSDDLNSVTGLALHEHGHFTETIDLLTGTDTITGNEEIMNRPGTGVVIQDVGRVVYDAEGELVFFAGGRKHSEVLIGDEVLCSALS